MSPPGPGPESPKLGARMDALHHHRRRKLAGLRSQRRCVSGQRRLGGRHGPRQQRRRWLRLRPQRILFAAGGGRHLRLGHHQGKAGKVELGDKEHQAALRAAGNSGEKGENQMAAGTADNVDAQSMAQRETAIFRCHHHRLRGWRAGFVRDQPSPFSRHGRSGHRRQQNPKYRLLRQSFDQGGWCGHPAADVVQKGTDANLQPLKWILGADFLRFICG